jgi:hypothetical protein
VAVIADAILAVLGVLYAFIAKKTNPMHGAIRVATAQGDEHVRSVAIGGLDWGGSACVPIVFAGPGERSLIQHRDCSVIKAQQLTLFPCPHLFVGGLPTCRSSGSIPAA